MHRIPTSKEESPRSGLIVVSLTRPTCCFGTAAAAAVDLYSKIMREASKDFSPTSNLTPKRHPTVIDSYLMVTGHDTSPDRKVFF